MRIATVAAITASLTLAATAQPMAYNGQQTRDIKALSAEETADLLAGRGMGLAKAGELNHYPGPAHVLELREKLALTSDQIAAVQASFNRMANAAKPIGAEIVQRERTLDEGMKRGVVTADSLARQTEEIGALRGRLRAIHLTAHLEMRAVLTAGQIAAYDTLRGYAGTPPSAEKKHHG